MHAWKESNRLHHSIHSAYRRTIHIIIHSKEKKMFVSKFHLSLRRCRRNCRRFSLLRPPPTAAVIPVNTIRPPYPVPSCCGRVRLYLSYVRIFLRQRYVEGSGDLIIRPW